MTEVDYDTLRERMLRIDALEIIAVTCLANLKNLKTVKKDVDRDFQRDQGQDPLLLLRPIPDVGRSL